MNTLKRNNGVFAEKHILHIWSIILSYECGIQSTRKGIIEDAQRLFELERYNLAFTMSHSTYYLKVKPMTS